MSALAQIEAGLRAIGYRPESLIHDYGFADVLSAAGEEQRVALAAFTQVPESYRSAAFGVITGTHDVETILRRRALGAPILFSIGDEDVGVWRVGAEGQPRLTERVSLDALDALFARNADRWNPQAVHRAKSLGQTHTAYQLDFVDLGLMPAIEHEIEQKLDWLLAQVITQLLAGIDDPAREEAVFRTTFRLLAAKILIDCQHPDATSWTDAPVREVLEGIETYYHLDHLMRPATDAVPAPAVEAAWTLLRGAINFRNISSDSLAFVYENTLVTADTRKRFGTHSTPRQIAEYVVGQLDLTQFDLADISFYEPFAGAGTFLVAALRHLREQLPDTLTSEERHAFLVSRITGAEIDSFACEVATLSLILADYPNANGWKIAPRDLFKDGELAAGAGGKRIILCNPPWEDFDGDERQRYPEMAAKSVSKPMAVLRTIIDCAPDALGVVLPQGFLRQQQSADLRQLLADHYDRIELTALPQRIFQHASFEAAVVVATGRRTAIRESNIPIQLRTTVVTGGDRASFLANGKITADRRRTKIVRSGELWIGALDELWEYLADYPVLGNAAEIHRGLQWFTQSAGLSAVPLDGFVKGVFKPADSLQQFGISATVYIDVREETAYRLGPLKRPWDKPKILANVSPRSRGPWRLDGALDENGLVPSQAFFGIWSTSSDLPPEAIEALINSPLASAFILEHATNQHLTNEIMRVLPLPKGKALGDVVAAVRRYRDARAAALALRTSETDQLLEHLLIDIDAQFLKAYDLPPRLERRLFETFRGHENERRVAHSFSGWVPEDFTAYIPLHEYVGPLLRDNAGGWVLETFTPAPEEEVERLRLYVE